ncbi:hypothetical protein Bbelb_305700 [Branchiostoma belcheri]|nr:hypothetical protein Bbelb_305700 [Branchiostoma belcheri]
MYLSSRRWTQVPVGKEAISGREKRRSRPLASSRQDLILQPQELQRWTQVPIGKEAISGREKRRSRPLASSRKDLKLQLQQLQQLRVVRQDTTGYSNYSNYSNYAYLAKTRPDTPTTATTGTTATTRNSEIHDTDMMWRIVFATTTLLIGASALLIVGARTALSLAYSLRPEIGQTTERVPNSTKIVLKWNLYGDLSALSERPNPKCQQRRSHCALSTLSLLPEIGRNAESAVRAPRSPKACFVSKLMLWPSRALVELSRRLSLYPRPRRFLGNGMTRFHTIAEVTALMALIALPWRPRRSLRALANFRSEDPDAGDCRLSSPGTSDPTTVPAGHAGLTVTVLVAEGIMKISGPFKIVPSAIQGRTVGTHIEASQTGEVLSVYSPTSGLECANAEQSDGSCLDYEVRFCCDPVDGMWSTWMAWSACSQSCGGGTQVRRRECDNPAPASGGMSCVGSPVQPRPCSTWSCPDCSKLCAVGTMDHSTCECTCHSHVLTATVRNMKNAPLEGATIHYADKPYINLGTTDARGSARVHGVCDSPVNLLVKKDGYSPTVATSVPTTSTSSTVMANLEILIAPIITQHPERRSRLVGQEVTFCCEAHGFPDPSPEDYEWFHDGQIMDKNVYRYSKQLTVTNLALDDAGEYKCRANSDAGAAYSESALLQVFGSAAGSYNAAPSPDYIKLPADCVQPDGTTLYSVGKCDQSPCVGSSYSSGRCNDTTKYCSSGGTLRAQIIDCGSYTINIMAIASCECLECGDPVTYIRGELLGGPNDQPVINADILVNGVLRGYTSFTGTFTLEIPANTKRLAVTFKDIYKNFVETTKILSFVEGESIYHRVHIRERAAPIVMSSVQTNPVDLGTVSGAEPIGQLEIPPNSFYTKDGQPYSGTVLASVSFIDPRDLTTVQDMPSDFTFVDQEGEEQQLETFGMFSLEFEDESGNEVEVGGTVDVFLNENVINFADAEPGHEVKLWSLNPETGRWEEESTVTPTPVGKRRKRQQSFTWNGSITVTRRNYNVDWWIKAGQRCYSKVRVYDDSSVLNSASAMVNNVNVEFVVVNTDLDQGNQRFARFYNGMTSTTGTGGVCVEGWCRPGTVTYVSATEGTTQYNAASPSELGFTPSGGYITGNNGKAFSTTLTHGEPSYTDRGTCNNAPLTSNHFMFYGNQVLSDVSEINTIPYDPDENRLRPDYLSWYPVEDPSTKRSCFMKVMVTGTNHENLRARVVSSVGVHSANPGSEYGRREGDVVPIGAATKGVCIEYKCSGKVWTTRNGQPYSEPSDIDYTLVTLSFLRNDGTAANCNREALSPFFSFINQGTLDTLQNDYSVGPPNNSDQSRFLFYDSPNTLGQGFGIYKATGADEIGKELARNMCLAGTSSGNGANTIDPEANWLEVLSHYTERGSRVYGCFLDTRKAFDTVWLYGMFYKVYREGTNGKMWRILKEMHTGNRYTVLLNGGHSREFNTTRGVNQGGVLSLMCYLLATNDVHQELKTLKCGVSLGGLNCSTPALADDICLLAGTRRGLPTMIDKMEDYGKRWRFRFAPEKSKCIVFGQKRGETIGAEPEAGWRMGPDTIAEVSQVTHVGVQHEFRLQSACAIDAACKKGRGKISAILATGLEGRMLNPVTAKKLYNTLVIPSMLHGCELWYPTASEMEKLERVHKMGAKRLQGMHFQTETNASLASLGMMPLRATIDKHKLLMFGRLARLHHTCLAKKIFLYRMYSFLLRKDEQTTQGFIRDCFEIAEQHGLRDYLDQYWSTLAFPSKDQWKDTVKRAISESEERRWREKINEHTCCPRLYKTHETNRRPHMLWYIAKKNPTHRENLQRLIHMCTVPVNQASRPCPTCGRDISDIIGYRLSNIQNHQRGTNGRHHRLPRDYCSSRSAPTTRGNLCRGGSWSQSRGTGQQTSSTSTVHTIPIALHSRHFVSEGWLVMTSRSRNSPKIPDRKPLFVYVPAVASTRCHRELSAHRADSCLDHEISKPDVLLQYHDNPPEIVSTYNSLTTCATNDVRNRSRPDVACRPHSYTLRNRASDVRRRHSIPTEEQNVWLPQNVPHSPAGRTALSRRTYRTLPEDVPHSPEGSPAQRPALSRRTSLEN